MIKVQNFCKRFEKLIILEDISFSISKGQIICLMGSSGAGKTTLLRCMIGLDIDFQGEITINDRVLSQYLKKQRISFVSQQYTNFEWLTAQKNIEIGFYKQKLSNEEKTKKVNDIIELVGLKGKENYYMKELSGGQKQRVAIGRALAQDAEIIAIDEPFNALDFQMRGNLQALLKQINLATQKTILFVTHDIEEAIFCADKIVLLSAKTKNIAHIYLPDFKRELSNEIKTEYTFVDLRKQIEKDFQQI